MQIRTMLLPLVLALTAPAAWADTGSPRPVPGKAQAAQAAPAVGRVNVNTADVSTLARLHGVGEKKAQAIVAYRKSHGPFNSLAQFEEVPGIGAAIIAKNKSAIVFR